MSRAGADPVVLVGAIAGAFGVRGEVKIRSFTAEPAAILTYGPLLDETGAVLLTVISARPVPDGFAAMCREVKTREEAMALRSRRLFVPRSAFPEPADDEFYHTDLIGLRLEALDGADLGRVRHVIAGPQDLLEIVATPGAAASWHLPFTRANVPVVDLAGGRLVADVPLGLIPLRGSDDQPDREPD